jgi:hypothetical protein
VVIFSAWSFSAKARSSADRLDVALFRHTAIDRVEPFNKAALQGTAGDSWETSA